MLRERIFQLEILTLPHPLSLDCPIGIGIESAVFLFRGETMGLKVLTHFLSIHCNVQTLNLTILSSMVNVEFSDKTIIR